MRAYSSIGNFVYIAASLARFIATADGCLDWLNNIPNSDDCDYSFADFMTEIDAVLTGHQTFKTITGYEL